MKLYHWTINREKLKKNGFKDRQDRHSEGLLGACFTDKLTGDPESINIGNRYSTKSVMKLVTVEIPEEDLFIYENKNEGVGYRAFRVPADIVNKFELQFPTVLVDRGAFSEIPF